jgi:hypothetical protein
LARLPELPSGGFVVAAPTAFEARLIRSAAPALDVRRTGMGRRRSQAASSALAHGAPVPLLVIAGFAGGLEAGARAGEVVVVEELRGVAGERRRCGAASTLAEVLEGAGIRVRRGVVVSAPRPVLGASRARLRAQLGAVAADMESLWLAPAVPVEALGVVRVLADAPRAGLWRPWEGVQRLLAAREALRAVAAALAGWAGAQSPSGVGDALGLSASPSPAEGGGRASSTN